MAFRVSIRGTFTTFYVRVWFNPFLSLFWRTGKLGFIKTGIELVPIVYGFDYPDCSIVETLLIIFIFVVLFNLIQGDAQL